MVKALADRLAEVSILSECSIYALNPFHTGFNAILY